ncbi:MAG: hypothetical protein H7841_14960 [Magnetospirillum sp. WYHS-4]
MATLFVATSKAAGKWGGDVGIGKHLYKVGLTDGKADEAVKALNDGNFAGATDWKLARKAETDATDESALIAKVARREKMVDPTYYPRLKGERGLFSIKLANVENHMLLQMSLANEQLKLVNPKAADIADYMIHLAARELPSKPEE